MRNLRSLHCRISLWIILALQLLLIASYFLLPSSEPTVRHQVETVKSHVSFVQAESNDSLQTQNNRTAYHTIYDKIKLNLTETTHFYDDFNSSLCYKLGTDLKAMHRSKDRNWNCDCLSDWHGKDCGQPEVIWRALLAYRKPFAIRGPRKYQRRIIYLFEVTVFDKTILEMRINELDEYVDVFVLYEDSRTDTLEKYLKHNIQLKRFRNKVVYVRNRNLKNIWGSIRNVISNLKNDDIILVSNINDIPNGLALQFLKLYDNWPEPASFRFRWSVYGFFWTHPTKTAVRGGASTVAYFYETLGNRMDLLLSNGSTGNKSIFNRGFIIGDLNHLGGWSCEFCYDSLTIIDFLNSRQVSETFRNLTQSQKIDNEYIENLIENGLYLDGKTELVRMHRYRERYYAPNYVINNSWNYDWLLTNMYSKLDYY